MSKEKMLWGRSFRIVDRGLDEREVSSFINSLKTPDNDVARKLEQVDSLVSDLAQLQDNIRNKMAPLDSLAKLLDGNSFGTHQLEQLESIISGLAERFGVDNEKTKHLDSLAKLAESTIIEADKQAESIKVEAEERARAEEERIVNEARDKASTEAERILAEAQEQANFIRREAEDLLTNSKQILDGEIRGLFDRAHEKLQDLQGHKRESSSTESDDEIAPQPPEADDILYQHEEPTSP
jgi:vacuolar-type H+-ATPase subunit E/Vma4